MFDRIRDGRTDLVIEHLAGGARADARDTDGTPLIGWCAYHGDVTAIRTLLAHGESLASLGDNLGLDAAAFHGHWQLCEFLLESGADAQHARADTRETPLHAVLSKANRPYVADIVALLIAHGADVNAATTPGVETGAFMRDVRTRGETPLHRAAAFGDERTITSLLAARARVDARDAFGDSPLTWASWHLRPPPILRLLAFAPHAIHPHNPSTYDHGQGWTAFERRGKPQAR